MNPEASNVRLKSKSKWYFPQRYFQIILLSFCVLAQHFLTYSAAVTTMYMTPAFNKSVASEHSDCSYVNKTQEYFNSVAEISKNDRYDWDEPNFSFKIPFVQDIFMDVGCLCGGILSDLFGVRNVVLHALLVGSITCLMIPTMMNMETDIINLYLLVVIIAIATGCTAGAVLPIVAHWAPVEERTTLLALSLGGPNFAKAFADALCFYLMKINNNRNNPIFVFGSFGLVMWVIWSLFGYSSYKDCPYVTKQEYLYLESEQYGSVTFGRKPLPVSGMIRSLPFWAQLASSTAHVVFWEGLTKVYPAFLLRAYGYELMNNNTWYRPVIFIVVFSGSLSVSLITDIVIFTESVQVTTMRKLLTIFGVMGPSIMFIASTYNDCNINMAHAMAILGGFFGSFYYAGSLSNVLDLAPNYSGFINGCRRLIRLPASLAFFTYFYFTTLKTSQKYRNLFWLVLFLKIVSIIPFMLFASGEEQAWNRPTNVKPKKAPEPTNESDDDDDVSL